MSPPRTTINLIFASIVLTGCAASGITQIAGTPISILPADIDTSESTIERQESLLASGKYLSTSGEVLPLYTKTEYVDSEVNHGRDMKKIYSSNDETIRHDKTKTIKIKIPD